MRSRGPKLAVLAALLWLAGCASAATPAPTGTQGSGGGGSSAAAGGSGQAGGGTKPSPCSLLTSDDLKTAFGVPFGPSNLVGTTADPHVLCEWAKVGSYTADMTLAIDDIGPSGFDCPLGGVRPVAGLGERAYLGCVGLHVKHGSWDLNFYGTESTTDQQLIDTAKAALSHL